MHGKSERPGHLRPRGERPRNGGKTARVHSGGRNSRSLAPGFRRRCLFRERRRSPLPPSPERPGDRRRLRRRHFNPRPRAGAFGENLGARRRGSVRERKVRRPPSGRPPGREPAGAGDRRASVRDGGGHHRRGRSLRSRSRRAARGLRPRRTRKGKGVHGPPFGRRKSPDRVRCGLAPGGVPSRFRRWTAFHPGGNPENGKRTRNARLLSPKGGHRGRLRKGLRA